MPRQVICCFLFWLYCTSLSAQQDRDLVLTDQQNKYNMERIVVGDLVSIKTDKGEKNRHRKEITEISDTSVILEHRDTIVISSILAITDKSLGKTYYKTGAIFGLAGMGSAGIYYVAYLFSQQPSICRTTSHHRVHGLCDTFCHREPDIRKGQEQ